MKWIKITDDNLPESGRECLVVCENKACFLAVYYDREHGWYSDGFGYINTPTHYALIVPPNEPQPEDGLVEALEMFIRAVNCNGPDAGDYVDAAERKAESALSAWEGAKA